jgi:hypothetical protein
MLETKMDIVYIQSYYYALPLVISLLLIVLGSNFKDPNKPVLSKLMGRVFYAVFLVFFVLWTISSFGLLKFLSLYSESMNGTYFVSGLMLIIYRSFTIGKSIN